MPFLIDTFKKEIETQHESSYRGCENWCHSKFQSITVWRSMSANRLCKENTKRVNLEKQYEQIKEQLDKVSTDHEDRDQLIVKKGDIGEKILKKESSIKTLGEIITDACKRREILIKHLGDEHRAPPGSPNQRVRFDQDRLIIQNHNGRPRSPPWQVHENRPAQAAARRQLDAVRQHPLPPLPLLFQFLERDRPEREPVVESENESSESEDSSNESDNLTSGDDVWIDDDPRHGRDW